MTADSPHPDVGVFYGTSLPRRQQGDKVSFSAWNSTDAADLAEVESGALAIDQLMRYEMDGMSGSGIFELLVRGDHYQRYPTWG